MTTPDHTLYLLPTDLRTAEDVARWLEDLDDDAPRVPLWHACDRLRARLDRERRQACRRGARYYIVQARAHHEDAARWPTLAPAEWDYPEECAEWVARSQQCLRNTLSRALAFRAAARQP